MGIFADLKHMRARARRFVSMALLLPLAACIPKRGPHVATPSYLSGCGCEADLFEHVGDRVFFNFDSSVLSSDLDAILTRQSAWLAKYPSVNVLVAGNADERGTETYNLALGQRRANAARDYLVAQGVSNSRIQTISYGKDCPVAAGNDQAAYQQNRTEITSVQGFNPQNCH